MDLQRIGDELEIASLLHRYARAVDTGDWELWRSLFTDDAVIDYSSVGGPAGDRVEISEWLRASMELLPMRQHFISNIEIIAHRGDSATVRAMFFNPFQIGGVAELCYCGGYYHHQMVRTADGWRSGGLREETAWFANRPSPEVVSKG